MTFHNTLLNTIEQSVIATDLHGIINYWNLFAEKLYGWSAAETLGRNILDLIAPESSFRQLEEIMSQLRRGESWFGEFLAQRKDGTTFPVQIINSPIYSNEGTLIGIVSVSGDITHRRRTERSLRESEIKYRTLLEQAADGIHTYDERGNFIETNSKLCEMLGYTAEELRRLKVEDLVPPEDLSVNPIRYDELRAGNTLLSERRLLRKDGTPIFVEISGRMIWDGVFQAIIRDVTGRKRVEQSLRESEVRFRAMFEQATVGIVQATSEGKLLVVNPGFSKFLGYSENEAQGMLIKDITHPDDYEREKDLTRRLTRGEIAGYSLEKRFFHRDGNVIWGNMTASLILEASGNAIYTLTIVEDITQRKNTEEALRRSHEELEIRVLERTAELEKANKDRVQVLQQLVTAQEDERRRLARDLHDQLGQQMTILRLKLEGLKGLCNDDEELNKQVEETRKVVRQLDSDIDFLTWQMRPTALDDFGLVAALEQYVQQWSHHFNIPTEFNARQSDVNRLEPEIETNFYRIAQETLNNVCKHAKASKVNIFLKPRDGSIVLIIEDDGIGFEPDKKVSSAEGMGLIGMRERAVLIGGTLEIESAKGKGTTVYVTVPILSAKKEQKVKENE